MIATNDTKQVRCAIYTRKTTEEGLEPGLQLARRPARGGRGLHQEPAARGLGVPARPLRRRRLHRRQHGAAGAPAADGRRRGRQGRLHRGLQGRPPQPLPAGLRQDHGDVRPAPGVARLGHAAVQHDHVHGPADAEHPAVLRPVRAGDHLRADPRQDRRRPAQGQVDRRAAGARLRPREGQPRQPPGGQSRGGRAGAGDLPAVPGGGFAAARRWPRSTGTAGRPSGTRPRRTHGAAGWSSTSPRCRSCSPTSPTSARSSYKGEIYDGEHEAIVDEDLFGRVQGLLRRNRNSGGKHVRNKHGAMLKGLVRCKHCGCGDEPPLHPQGQQAVSLLRLRPRPERRLDLLPVPIPAGPGPGGLRHRPDPQPGQGPGHPAGLPAGGAGRSCRRRSTG